MSEKKCKIYLPIETYEKLKNHANAFDISVDDLASEILAHGLNNLEIVDKSPTEILIHSLNDPKILGVVLRRLEKKSSKEGEAIGTR